MDKFNIYPITFKFYVKDGIVFAPVYSIYNSGMIGNINNGKVYRLIERNNKKYMCVEKVNRDQYITYTTTNVIQIINGFECYEVLVENKKLALSYSIWFTKDFQDLKHPSFFDFPDLPVKYESIIPSADTHLKYTLSKIKEENVDMRLMPDTLMFPERDCSDAYN